MALQHANHRHFLDIADLDAPTILALLQSAKQLKAAHKSAQGHATPLTGKSLGMIFEKSSTRTRVSI